MFVFGKKWRPIRDEFEASHCLGRRHYLWEGSACALDDADDDPEEADGGSEDFDN